MSGRFAIVAVLLAVAMLVGQAPQARAQSPRYILLVPQSAPLPGQPSYQYTPGYVQPVARCGYSYGWFGASPGGHASRSFGYYRNYTQWQRD